MNWISVEDRLPNKIFDKVKVKKATGEEFIAFFHQDKNIWREFYGIKPTYWGNAHTDEPLHGITHWMPLREPPGEK